MSCNAGSSGGELKIVLYDLKFTVRVYSSGESIVPGKFRSCQYGYAVPVARMGAAIAQAEVDVVKGPHTQGFIWREFNNALNQYYIIDNVYEFDCTIYIITMPVYIEVYLLFF